MNHSASNTFATTRWTQVLASHGKSEEGRRALSELCALYYAPVVAFLRSEGRTDDAARELAHDFFARVLERPSFSGADPVRGRFRSYLLGALKHFLANERVRSAREKRGGQFIHQPLENDTVLGPAVADSHWPAPDTQFDREWALNIIQRVFSVMKQEAAQNNALDQFEALKPFLIGGNSTASQTDLARTLNMKDGTIRVAIHRLRARFRELVRAEISQTVSSPTEISSEMQHLIAALA